MSVGHLIGQVARLGGHIMAMSEGVEPYTVRALLPIVAISEFERWLVESPQVAGTIIVASVANDEDA